MRQIVPSLLARALSSYLVRSPLPRGKGFITRRLLVPLLPRPPASFIAQIPAGGLVRLQHREALGIVHRVYGGFERAELALLCDRLHAGAVVFDVGANVGYVTIPLAIKVGPSGRVVSCEPEPENVTRLADNVALNGLANVEIRQVAIGAYDGEATLYLSDDSVYHTTATAGERMTITSEHETGRSVSVDLCRLDTVWRQSGSPNVALIKIDVEGTEVSALEGARTLIESCRPLVLVETMDERLDEVEGILGVLGYSHLHRADFADSNHLFEPN